MRELDSRAVAVFGSSEPVPGSTLYEQAREMGRSLAGRGLPVLTGGYGGVMEGASRGAHESGGRSIGVICEIFSHRDPNPYLHDAIQTPDLHVRTQELIDRAAGFVVLEGKSGTLAELSFLWALDRAGCLDRRPVVLLGEHWPEVLAALRGTRLLDQPQQDITLIARDPEDAADKIHQGIRQRAEPPGESER